jgi:hypothetical protein
MEQVGEAVQALLKEDLLVHGVLAVGVSPLLFAWQTRTMSLVNTEAHWKNTSLSLSDRDHMRLTAGQTSGSFTVLPFIPPTEATAWKNLVVSTYIAAGSTVKVRVCDEDGALLSDSIVPGNSAGLSLANGANTISIANVPITTWPTLKFDITGTQAGAEVYSAYMTFDSSSDALTYQPLPTKVRSLSGSLTQAGGTVTYKAIDYNWHLPTTAIVIRDGNGTAVRTVTRTDTIGFRNGWDVTQTYSWDGKNDLGVQVPNGTYTASVAVSDAYYSGLTVSPPFTLSGTTLTATGCAIGTRTSAQCSVASPAGTLRFSGSHSSRFSLSLDGVSWSDTLAKPSGTTTFFLGVTPQSGDGTLSARLGVPA